MFGLLIAALAAPLLAFAAPVELSKRTPGRATFYQVGLGACGQWNNPGDFIVALNQQQFETGGYPSSQCGRGITITYNGKSTHAVVMDECPAGGCSYGDLDMSEGLFTFFEPTSTGVFYMTWEFDGEGAPSPPAHTAAAYTPPTTTDTPPSTTSTPPPTTPSTSTSSSSTTTSSSTSSSSSQVVSAQDVPSDDSAGPEPTASGNALDSVNVAAMHLAGLVVAAGQAVNPDYFIP